MHPKYKKAAEPAVADKAAIADEKAHKFPGLAIPDRPGWVCTKAFFYFKMPHLVPVTVSLTPCFLYIIDGR